MTKSYPRLPLPKALALSSEYARTSIDQLGKRWSPESEFSNFYSTAVDKVDPNHLTAIRGEILSIAVSNQFPSSHPRGGYTGFDQRASVMLFEMMDIIPADAGSDEVWSFLTLILLPDIAHWRWPNTKSLPNYERIIGRPRNAFRRLWWRCYSLGPASSACLLEDEAVSIMERTTFGGNPFLAKSIAETHLSVVNNNTSVPRTDLLREVMKALRRLAPFTAFTGMPESAVVDTVREVYADCLRRRGLDPIAESLEPSRVDR